MRQYRGMAEKLHWFAGPCSIETPEQWASVSESLLGMGVDTLRGGIFKMRTRPESFQGLREEGIELIRAAKAKQDFAFISEVSTPEQVELMAPIVDIFQIGSRSMYAYELLKEVAKHPQPIFLKRAFSATLDEWLGAADYCRSENSDKEVWMCERGVRGFDETFRNTLDVNAIAYIAQKTPYKAVVDASHATGVAGFVEAGTLSGIAAGAEGVMVEVHPDPANALSDADQAVDLASFEVLKKKADALFAHIRHGKQ